MQKSVYKDLEAMTMLAVHEAKAHGVNYNIIISNPVNGVFDENQSTYEMVADSYFEKERPNAVIVDTTDSIISREEVFSDEELANIERNKRLFSNERVFEITNPYAEFMDAPEIRLAKEMDYMFPNKPPQYRRETPKVQNNEPCSCGSGKKFKKCCK